MKITDENTKKYTDNISVINKQSVLGKVSGKKTKTSLVFYQTGGGTVGQDVVELICQNARKTRQNEAIAL